MSLDDKIIEQSFNLTQIKRNRVPMYLEITDILREIDD